ncbi:glycosyltransferase [Roseivirga sp.]|uniref:glycosyltransferase n=1 Tax=Roseivirga sp. TaxID=1964215 RepID=UPI003B8CA3AD
MTEPRTIIPQNISVIIPVKDNQAGIHRFLVSFFLTQIPDNYPKELIIVDNNSAVPVVIPEGFLNRGLSIENYECKKIGPAAARNIGAKNARGQWLLFVDSDCIPTQSMVSGYLRSSYDAIGYQGFVGALGNDYVSRYYESQQIHLPPSKPDGSPKYLVTANALVLKEVFDSLGGFNEQFTMAGGEDIELAIRLAEEGQLSYARESKIIHDFNDGLSGFVKRFIRYGKGNRLAQQKLEIPLYPLPFRPKNRKVLLNYFFAFVQWICLSLGFLFKSIELMIKRRQ